MPIRIFSLAVSTIFFAVLIGGCRAQAPEIPATATTRPVDSIQQATPTIVPLPTRIPSEAQPGQQAATNAPLPTSILTERQSTPPTPLPVERAKVRFVHADAESEGFNVYLDDQLVGFNLRHMDVSGQAEVDAGVYSLRLLPAGGRADGASLYEIPVTLTGENPYVIAIIPSGNTSYRLEIYEEDISPLALDESRITFVNARADSDFVNVGADQVAFGEQSEAIVYKAERERDDLAALIDDDNINFQALRSYIVILAGTTTTPSIMMIESDVAGQFPVQFVNLSAEVGAVDLYINGRSHIVGTTLNELTSPISMSTEPQIIDVYESGANPESNAPLLSETMFVEPGTLRTYLTLIGPAHDLEFLTIAESDIRTGASEARITFVNAISGLPFVTENSTNEQFDLAYGQTTTRTYPASRRIFQFVVDSADSDHETIYEDVVSVPERDYAPGHSYVVMMTNGSASPLIIEQVVGAEAVSVAGDIPNPPPEIYFVNALSFDVQIIADGTLVASNLPARSGASKAQSFSPGQHEFVVNDMGTLSPIYTADRLLQAGDNYTLLVYGDETSDNYTLIDFPVSSEQLEGTLAAEIRLINVSLDQARLGIAVTPSDPTTRPNADEGNGGGDLPSFAQRLDFDAVVGSGRATPLLSIGANTYDIYIYNNNTNALEAALYDVSIASEMAYDLVVVPTSDGVFPHTAFVTEIPIALD